MSRTFTDFATKSPGVCALVNGLSHMHGNVEGYRAKMRALGRHLAESIFPLLQTKMTRDICVICAVEDADFLARGFIEKLEFFGLGENTRMICMWNQRVKSEGVYIAPVLRCYEENFDKNDSVFIILKSIISEACVVKTNLIKVMTSAEPQRVFIAAPVMLQDAQKRLAREFPDKISKKFEFVHFATDTEKSENGEDVLPGIGGSVYELLGLGDGKAKNKYIPDIVRERRRKAFPMLQAA